MTVRYTILQQGSVKSYNMAGSVKPLHNGLKLWKYCKNKNKQLDFQKTL